MSAWSRIRWASSWCGSPTSQNGLPGLSHWPTVSGCGTPIAWPSRPATRVSLPICSLIFSMAGSSSLRHLLVLPRLGPALAVGAVAEPERP